MGLLRRLRRRLRRARTGKRTIEDVVAEKLAAWASPERVRGYADAVDVSKPGDMFSSVIGRIFAEYVPAGARVLDVGCGTGRLTFLLADKGCSVVAFDVSREMLSYIDANKGSRTVATLHGDGREIPAPDGEFDAVVSMDYLLHFPEWPDYLREKARVCRHGGLIMYNFESADHTAMAEREGRETYRYIYTSEVTDSSRAFCAACTKEELLRVAGDIGLALVAIHPYGLLVDNAFAGHSVGTEAHKAFSDECGRMLQKDDVMSFVSFLEAAVVRHLPHWVTRRHAVVLRRQ